VLVPSRVDQASGYCYYDTAQLDEARLVVMMRQLQLPLAAVKELCLFVAIVYAIAWTLLDRREA
jgi:DNA-binding transcriptional MerR regulator